MEKRVEEKINQIRAYLEELESIMPPYLDLYKKDLKAKAAAERYFEKITEALTDLAHLIIKEKGFDSAETDTKAYEILSDNKTISESLSKRLIEAKNMRNIISHQYEKIEDEIVFEAIIDELPRDARQFIQEIEDDKTE